jgi:hypothetical protein
LGRKRRSGWNAIRLPRAGLLWAASALVALLAALVERETQVDDWLKAHKLPDIIHPFGISPVWLWFMAYFANEIWLRYAGTNARGRSVGEQHRILSKTAGNLDSVTCGLHDGHGVLSEESTRSIVRSFLARVVDYAALLINRPDVTLRACCLVPIVAAENAEVLRAWEYDAPHDDRGWSQIPVGNPLAGYVALKRRPYLVADTADLASGEVFDHYRYRSIIGFPLMVGGQGGRLVGVVTIDAQEPHVFSARGLGVKLEDALSPILAAIALTVDSKDEAEQYYFPPEQL